MTTIDLSYESAWTVAAKGKERHARIGLPPDSPFGNEQVNITVLCKDGVFSQQDRDHAQHRAEGMVQYLEKSVGRMMRNLGLKSIRAFIAEHGKPSVMIIGGDKTHWSVSFQHRVRGVSYFCDWKEEEIVRFWTAH